MPSKKNPRARSIPMLCPILPLRDSVLLPHTAQSFFVGRENSIRALEAALEHDRHILVVSQCEDSDTLENPSKELYSIGTFAEIVNVLTLPDGTRKVMLSGISRAAISDIIDNGVFLSAPVMILDETPVTARTATALMRTTLNLAEKIAKQTTKLHADAYAAIMGIKDPAQLVDAIGAQMGFSVENLQSLLELLDVEARFALLLSLLEAELEMAATSKRALNKAREQMEKHQKRYLVNEQIKALRGEIGEDGDDDEMHRSELDNFADKINKAGFPKEVLEKAQRELKRLKQMPPMSSESTVIRTYLEHLLEVPWKKANKLKQNLTEAEKILNDDHEGLEEVKDRILEYLAVQKRMPNGKSPILCLVGPPGVGKTSLGRSIARATGREYVRMALGGVRDEAEIRGHRRTYIGAMPGRIIQQINKSKTNNPFFLLDELDKLGTDYRGDPASALLEVLDPEQNKTFQDHYLEVPVDLSKVLFVATANSMNIPPALLDRLEIIHLSGYTEKEKIHIARNHLLPRQLKEHGLASQELILENNAILDIIRYYTGEAGVRNLERQIGKLCRKAVRILSKKNAPKLVEIKPEDLETHLGVQRYRFGRAEAEDRVGQVTGLAWTRIGGNLLSIEAALVPGKGSFTQTGSLGNVMKESVQAALTVTRSRAAHYGFASEFMKAQDLHIHVPEGATPKDGPSAGIAMCTALISAITQIPVRADVAMTGEITLRGEVLPIGGLKEKLLAAQRGGIRTVLIPHENQKDLAEIPDNIKEGLEIFPVRWIDEVIPKALVRMPEPKAAEAETAETSNLTSEIIIDNLDKKLDSKLDEKPSNVTAH